MLGELGFLQSPTGCRYLVEGFVEETEPQSPLAAKSGDGVENMLVLCMEILGGKPTDARVQQSPGSNPIRATKKPADPRNARLYSHRGEAYGRKGDAEAAIRDFSRAIKLEPGFAAAYLNRARAHAGRAQVFHHWEEDLDKALTDYTTAIRLAPDNGRFYDRIRKSPSRHSD